MARGDADSKMKLPDPVLVFCVLMQVFDLVEDTHKEMTRKIMLGMMMPVETELQEAWKEVRSDDQKLDLFFQVLRAGTK